MKKRSNLIFLLLAVLLTTPALIGILHSGFFLSDDGNWMVIRFSSFYEELRNGQFPVRFLSRLNGGFGYPVADFLYPLFMYIGVPIHVLGFNFVDTVKIIFAGSMLASSVFCFLWLRKLFDNLSSLVGSLVYTLFPYHLWDVYKRGSVGEVLALAIVPFVLWQIERKSLIWSAIGIAALILAHNTLAILFLPLIIIYLGFNILISRNKKQLIYQYTSILVIGLGLSAFFWIPAIYDLQYTVFSKTQVSDLNSYFAGLNLIGLSTFTVVFLIFLFMVKGIINPRKHRLTVIFLVIGILSIFLSISQSELIWNFLPSSFIQFPFRLLSLTMLCISFLAACIVSVLSGKKKIITAGFILVLIFISAWPFLIPRDYQYHEDSFYSTNQASTTVKDEYMPKWATKIPLDAQKKVEADDKISITSLIDKGSRVSFDTSSSQESLVQINRVYFPGWEVRVDGKQVPIDYNSNGLIRFDVPSGNHSVVSEFGETGVRLIADIVSLLGLLLILLLFMKKKLRKL